MKQTAGRLRSAERESASFFILPLRTKNEQAVNAVIRHAQHTPIHGAKFTAL